MTFQEYCLQLESKIIASYSEGVTLEQAERLAGEFLAAQLRVSQELKNSDLDARMKRIGVKAVRSAVYTKASSPGESGKKPTEAALEAIVNMTDEVLDQQDAFDKAEAEKDNLERYYNIFREAHIFYRGVSKGRFE